MQLSVNSKLPSPAIDASKGKGSKEKEEDRDVGTDGDGKEIGRSGDDQIAQALGVRILQKTLSLGMTR